MSGAARGSGGDEAESGRRPWSLLRRAAGAAVLVLGLTPLYRLAGGGPGGADMLRAADGRLLLAWTGTAGAVLLFALLARWTPPEPRWPERLRAAVGAGGRDRGAGAAHASLAAAGGLLAAAVSLGVFGGGPALLDTAVQLLHSGFLEGGRLSGPDLEMPEFRSVQFMVESGRGWVSQYPPGQVALLAGGLAAGVPWLVGPAAHALAIWWTARAAGLAFGGRKPALLAAGAVAASPLLLTLSGANLSHAPASAAAAATAYLALRSARRGGTRRALAAGVAAGVLFTIRPYSGVVLGGGLLLLGLRAGRRRGSGGREPRPGAGGAGAEGEPGTGGSGGGADWWWRRLAAATAGAVPLLLLVAAYNAHFFGHPLRFGYLAAAGPSAGIGFHVDPWGVPFGPIRAIGLTAADLTAMGTDLLRTPVPVTLLAGGYLLLARRLSPGGRLAAFWALGPVAANAVYWHHDLTLGPRMLGEAGPGWALLLAAAALAVVRRAPEQLDWPGRPTPRAALLWTGGAVLAAALVLGPSWVVSHADRADPDPPAAVRSADSAVVFVHESWRERLGARLSARGLRMDSVRSLLRRHRPCRVEGMLVLGTDPGTGREDLLRRCRRQRRSDRLGGLGLATFLWRGDLPGVERDGPTYVRDLGPEANREYLEAHPDRDALGVLLPGRAGEQVRLLPYEAAMDSLWGGSDEP